MKVDLLAVPRRDLRRLARSLRGDDRLLLAEKVETDEDFDASLRAGFDRFQGYFFARPTVLEGAGIDPAQTTLVRLMQQISTGSDNSEIVESLKQDAKLGVNLIRIVNTAGSATRVRLESIEDGVRHLGLRQLSRWVSVLLYAQGQGSGAHDPLLTAAAHRGRLMEQVAAAAARTGKLSVDRERAFLVGMLSLVDALLGRPIEEVVRELRLGPDIALALLAREGELGRLLLLAEATERGAFDAAEQELEALGLSLAELQAFEVEAYAWLHALQKTLLG